MDRLGALPAITKFTSITIIVGDSNGRQPYLYIEKIVGGVNFCLGLRVDAAIMNSSGDVLFTATAEYSQWRKNGKSLPTFLGGTTKVDIQEDTE